MLALLSFLFFLAAVAALTWWFSRKQDQDSSSGFFLAGRSLTFPLIAGSLLLTNLSTEQLVGLNGAAYIDGLSVMVWEVVAVVALVGMALFFLPRFIRAGVTTVPEFLAQRYDRGTETITNLIFLIAYVGILLPIILYTGATGMLGILDVPGLTGLSPEVSLWALVWGVGIIGSIYALFGGMRSVVVSDSLNGILLLTGGFLIVWLGIAHLGDPEGGDFGRGLERLAELPDNRFNSVGGEDSSVPFPTLFTGVMLLNFFYWTTNQQIIQRTFGASSLAEGQKGVLLTGALKLLGPLYLVLPGIIAWALYAEEGLKADLAYGRLVRDVLPAPLTGFFAAAMIGAILSSFNSALNSACTLFSLGLYRRLKPEASDEAVVGSGRIFGWIVAIAAMIIAPLLANTESIFAYLQKMNGIYFIPIFAVVLVAMFTRRVPPVAAKTALLTGFAVIAIGYFVPPFNRLVAAMHEFHFLGLVFSWLIILQLLIGEYRPLKQPWQPHDSKVVDMTPWKHARLAGGLLLAVVALIYLSFADFSVYP